MAVCKGLRARLYGLDLEDLFDSFSSQWFLRYDHFKGMFTWLYTLFSHTACPHKSLNPENAKFFQSNLVMRCLLKEFRLFLKLPGPYIFAT